MASGPMIYPLNRLETKKLGIPAAVQSFTTESLVQSSVNPDRLMLILVPQYIYEDNYKTNPTEFFVDLKSVGGKTVSLIRSTLSLNGQPLETGPMGSADKMKMTSFRNFYECLGQLGQKEDAAISFASFTGGYFLQMFDLSASSRAYNNDMAKQPTKAGHLRLELFFSGPLPYSLYLISMAEYPSSVSISKNRAVSYSYIA